MRDKKTKEAFIKFLQKPENKDLRFWQAIRAFWGAPFVLIAEHLQFEPKEEFQQIKDTYYIEADELLTKEHKEE